MHPVYSGIPLIPTLIGWGYLIKSTLYFVYPKLGLRSLANLSEESAGKFRWAGIGLMLVGGLLLFAN